MKILTIGNGFDLYHNLPTRYSDFLEFCSVMTSLSRKENIVNMLSEAISKELPSAYNFQKISDENVKQYVKYLENENVAMKKKLFMFLDNNLWLKYFNKAKKLNGGSWVDFESEISKVVQSMDYCYKNAGESNLESSEQWARISIFSEKKKGFLSKLSISAIKEDILSMRDSLHKDLERLIGALEIYLNDFVEKMPVNYLAPELLNEQFDKLLSFNYTSTYERLYCKDRTIDCEYIHGKADATDDKVDMVLGIDEYLKDEEMDNDTTFIRFKKYFQILQKRTEVKYKEWITQIDKNKEPSEVVFFGHSLNFTDKGYLQRLIMDENIKTRIYYYSEGQYGRLLENLIRVIGKMNTITYVGEDDQAKIRFIKQKEPVEIK